MNREMKTRAFENARDRRAAIRITVEEPEDLFGRAIARYAERTYGEVLDNVLVLLKHRPALRALLAFERRVAKFDALDRDLKALAVAATAANIGCSWCLDFSYYLAHTEGHNLEKFQQLSAWRDTAIYTSAERRVLEYAEAMTETPPTVSDELVGELIDLLGEPAVIELTMMIAIENERARFNRALGLTSQGFSDHCEIPHA